MVKLVEVMDMTPKLDMQARLRAVGVERVTKKEARQIAMRFGQEMKEKLAGRKSSLAMIPTFLHSVEPSSLQSGTESAVVEIGGTHVRSAMVGVNQAGEIQVTNDRVVPLSDVKGRKYDSTDEFADEVALDVMPSLSGKHPDRLAIIWSYKADAFQTPSGVDAISTTQLSKELVIKGVEERPVGDFIIRGLQRQGLDFSDNTPRVVLNDTTAVLLASNATLQAIVATGMNMAFAHSGDIFNTEAGGFTGVPHTSLTSEIDRASERPGQYLAEKQISGKYMGKMFTLALARLGITGKEYSSSDMSDILAEKDTSLQHYDEMNAVAKTLRDRSAQLLSAMIVGVVQAFPEDFPQQEITIPIDGTFFGKTPGYQDMVAAYTNDLLEGSKKVTLEAVSDTGIKGAGIAALSMQR